ncbi:MAG TPA: DUF72 domain-containing protein [Patescibacteria group bacterium]|nr:DUF72 domain-containing protein [Patescibacteria group bacterium]
MTLWIGTSGWQYRHWRGKLYAVGLPTARWFDRYAESFDTVELNVTFYRQPSPTVFEGWARRAPDGFLFALKASRFLTHVRRLREPRESVDILLEGARRLGPHLGPVLVQLPPDMAVAPDALEETLAAFPKDLRVAVEPRHRSWFIPEVRDILRRHGAALCWADRRGPRTPVDRDWVTADWGYVRFHAGNASPRGCYGEHSLATWLERIRESWPRDHDVFLFWNNDHRGCAPRDAGRFAAMARAAGLDVTHAPEPDRLPVG